MPIIGLNRLSVGIWSQLVLRHGERLSGLRLKVICRYIHRSRFARSGFTGSRLPLECLTDCFLVFFLQENNLRKALIPFIGVRAVNLTPPCTTYRHSETSSARARPGYLSSTPADSGAARAERPVRDGASGPDGGHPANKGRPGRRVNRWD